MNTSIRARCPVEIALRERKYVFMKVQEHGYMHLYGVISIILGYSTSFNECFEEGPLNCSHCRLAIREMLEAIRGQVEKE